MGSKLSNEEAPVDENSEMSKRYIAPTSSQESEKKRLSMKHESFSEFHDGSDFALPGHHP